MKVYFASSKCSPNEERWLYAQGVRLRLVNYAEVGKRMEPLRTIKQLKRQSK